MLIRSFLVSALFVSAACGSDDPGTTPDARAIDGTPSSIVSVTCPATPAASFTTVMGMDGYKPEAEVTISQGQIVQFTMARDHDVTPQSGAPSNLAVAKGETKCFMFTAAGTFRFGCSPHGFGGAVIVN